MIMELEKEEYVFIFRIRPDVRPSALNMMNGFIRALQKIKKQQSLETGRHLFYPVRKIIKFLLTWTGAIFLTLFQ